MRQITATPYAYPIDHDFNPRAAALIVIDMQRDFCDPEGYMGRRGDDVTAARALIPRIVGLRAAARRAGVAILYTREGHIPSLGDLPATKRAKTRRAGAEIGSTGPLGRLLVRGEVGWEIVEELAPAAGEAVIDKPGTGAFFATDLEHQLRVQGVRQVVLVGVTTGICVSTTAREAADRGFDVLVVSDCCAEPDPRTHDMALALLQAEGGYIAAIADCASVLGVLADHGIPSINKN